MSRKIGNRHLVAFGITVHGLMLLEEQTLAETFLQIAERAWTKRVLSDHIRLLDEFLKARPASKRGVKNAKYDRIVRQIIALWRGKQKAAAERRKEKGQTSR